ncbi:PVA12, partial [Symbiodinium microadriaticum]
VALDPPDVLVFELLRDVSPRLVLRISNISKGKVAIKVKTTQPSWYYVRPNQHVVDVGSTEEVIISLNTVEC